MKGLTITIEERTDRPTEWHTLRYNGVMLGQILGKSHVEVVNDRALALQFPMRDSPYMATFIPDAVIIQPEMFYYEPQGVKS